MRVRKEQEVKTSYCGKGVIGTSKRASSHSQNCVLSNDWSRRRAVITDARIKGNPKET